MKFALPLALGLLSGAAAPAAAGDAIGATAPPAPIAGATASSGRVVNNASSCGAAFKGDARFEFRRSIDGMDAGTITVRPGKKAAASLEPGTYDVRVYLYQRRAYRYITTRHLNVTRDRWEASFGCVGTRSASLTYRNLYGSGR
jgi:hypothetical protein